MRRLKVFIVSGTMLFTVAFGILIRFRGGTGDSGHSGVIGGQVLLGIGKLFVHCFSCAMIALFTDIKQPVGCSHTLPKPASKQPQSTNVSKQYPEQHLMNSC